MPRIKRYILNGQPTLDSTVFLKRLEKILKENKEFKIIIPAGDEVDPIEGEIIDLLEQYNVSILVENGRGVQAEFKASLLETLGQASGGTAGFIVANAIIEAIEETVSSNSELLSQMVVEGVTEEVAQEGAQVAVEGVAEGLGQGAGQVLEALADFLGTPVGGFVFRSVIAIAGKELGKRVARAGSRRYILRTYIKSAKSETLEYYLIPESVEVGPKSTRKKPTMLRDPKGEYGGC